MIVMQSWGNYFIQLAFLFIAINRFSLPFLNLPALLIFMFSLCLSDLAIVLYLCELAIATHGKVFSFKFVEVPDSSNLLYRGSPPYFSPT